ncbi:MAG: DUF362 domain-containing protein [Oscillospiraceae bacterium]
MDKKDIFVIYGDSPAEMAKKLLREAAIENIIGDRRKKIGLKPNLVLAAHPESGATTHPEILAGTIEYLRENGFTDISVIEGSWVGARTQAAFKTAGYSELSAKYGVPLIDTQADSWHEYSCAGMTIKICDSAMAVDFMINMPVLKGHCQTTVTCALKNNKGVIPNSEKRRFHSLGLHKPIAHLNTVAKNDFILVDGICGDLDFEEGGNPVQMNRMMAALDPVLCDAYVCDLMGYSVGDVPYIQLAAKLGIGCCDTKLANIKELNAPTAGTGSTRSTRRIDRLSRYAAPKDACSACYGSLIHALSRLEDAGRLDRLSEKICIGQGYKGVPGKVGVGACTKDCKRSLSGCPPKAIDILEFIERELL